MMFTSQMIQLFAIVLGKDSQRVTETLLREGVLQFINISEIDGEKIDNLFESESEVDLSEILAFLPESAGWVGQLLESLQFFASDEPLPLVLFTEPSVLAYLTNAMFAKSEVSCSTQPSSRRHSPRPYWLHPPYTPGPYTLRL